VSGDEPDPNLENNTITITTPEQAAPPKTPRTGKCTSSQVNAVTAPWSLTLVGLLALRVSRRRPGRRSDSSGPSVERVRPRTRMK
jgi:hypothetical protein